MNNIMEENLKNMYDAYSKILEEKDKKITDLEAKLAESESEVKVGEFWHSAYQGKQLDYDKVYAELRQSYDENEQLKQQLSKYKSYKTTDERIKQLTDLYFQYKEESNQLKQQRKLLLADLNDAIKYIEIYNEKKNIGYYNTCLYHLDMIKKKLQENNDEKL